MTETGGHDFTDADVVSAEDSLRDLLRSLDDFGVTMVESDYRELSDEDKSLTIMFVAARKSGTKALCPIALHPFAIHALLDECADHADEQEQVRKHLMRCQFGKPSPTKDEEGTSKIKMTFKIPKADISPSTADRLWGYQRVLIEFGLLSIQDWHQMQLPEFEDRIISCEAEVSGYSCTRHDWKFSALVPHDEDHLTPDTAFDDYWKNNGSIRVTPLGEPKEKVAKLDTPKPTASTHTPLEGQKSLWNPVNDSPDALNRRVNDVDNRFMSPDEYMVPLTSERTSLTIYIGQGADGQWYSSSDFYYVDKEGEAFDEEFGNPLYRAETGFPSGKQAAIAEVGHVIGVALAGDALPKIVSELKDYLKHLETGGELTPMPE